MHCPHFDIRTSSFPVIFLLLLHKVFAATKINDVLTDTSWAKMRVPMNLCGEEHILMLFRISSTQKSELLQKECPIMNIECK